MTDELAVKPAGGVQKPRGKPFKQGFDERRWMDGSKKPRVPKDVKALADALMWEIASEELTNPNTGETVDRLRALLRSMTTSKQSADKQAFLDRLLGKVPQNVDVTSGREKIKGYIVFTPDQWEKRDDSDA